MSIFNFGKKKVEKSCSCCGNCESCKKEEVIARVKVLGGGCAKCNELEASAVQALTELGMDTTIEHVKDYAKIASYGVMTTPALVIDEKVVSFGKVLKKDEVIEILKNLSRKPKVAFICNHNSCRSQIAEALGKKLASDVFESYSAGTIIKDRINEDAVRIMKEMYEIDMEKDQFNKKIEEIPAPDVVIFMGCNVSCPNIKSNHTENWELEDPTGQSDEFFKEIINKIYENIEKLKEKLS